MMLYKLVKEMDTTLFDNRVISMTNLGSIGRLIQESGTSVYTLGLVQGSINPVGLWRLVKILRRTSPDIVQTWLYHADILGLAGTKLVGIRNLVWNLRCSSVDMSNYSRLSSVVQKAGAYFSGYPKAVIVNSRNGKIDHESIGYHPRRWEIIPNGFDINHFKPNPVLRAKFRQELGLDDNTMLIGMIARMDPMKGQGLFLQAAQLLNNSLSVKNQVHFILAGRDVNYKNSELRQTIEELNIKQYVHLLGEISNTHEIMAAMDIMTSASLYGEGFSNVIAEAMACGVPCVVTDVGDSAFIVGDTGIIVPPGKPEELLEGWQQLLSLDYQQKSKLKEEARRRITELFELKYIVQQYSAVYQGLVGDNYVL